MRVKIPAEANTLAPMGIHIMLMVQPPGMGMPRDMIPLDMEWIKFRVAAQAAAKIRNATT
jgi:hypothetical protein